MLSIYDAGQFALHKRTFGGGFLMGCVFLILVAVTTLILHLSFPEIQALLTSAPGNPLTSSAVWFGLYHFLTTPEVLFKIMRIILQMAFVVLLIYLFFFVFYYVKAKRDLFQYPPVIHFFFFLRVLFKSFFLILPLLGLFYVMAKLHLSREIIIFLIRFKQMALQLPSRIPCFVNWAAGVGSFLYFTYVFTQFADRFSFQGLIRIRTFFKHIPAYIELLGLILVATLFFMGSQALLYLVCQYIDKTTVGFFFLISYVFIMVLFNRARVWFLLPFGFYGLLLLVIHSYGLPVKPFIWPVMLLTTLYFFSFFLYNVYFATIAHLISQTAYVFQKNKLPVSDMKKTNPEKLAPIQKQYDDFLDEHKNKEQDNFFHDIKLEVSDDD